MSDQKMDFSWPVNGTSRRNYEVFYSWFAEHEDAIRVRRLVIWGAGSRGSVFASLMRRAGFHDFLFVDSNPKIWGGCACGADIIPPNELERHRGKVILVSPENSGEIELYLDQHGYRRNEDYFLIETDTDALYVEEFLRPYKRGNLILGSCEFTSISIHDEDCRCMEDLLFQSLGRDNTKILTAHGIGLRAQYNIFHTQIASGLQPKHLILQISIDTLVAKDHLFPHTQHTELLKMLLNTQNSPSEEFCDYFKTACERSRNPLMSPFRGHDMQHSNAKIRNYFQYYYMGSLDKNTEGLVYLRKILDEAYVGGVDVLLFVLPVNYQLAREVLEDKFDKRYDENLSKVKSLISTEDARFLDLSYKLESKFFAWPEAPNASLNSQGRQIVTKLLSQAIEEMV